MTDSNDADEKTAFVLSLPRKVTELRATLGTIVADTRSSRMRDELRRRLHALYTSARGFGLVSLSEGLREGIAHLDALRASSVLGQRDLDNLGEFIATLSTLAQRDLPERPDLFERPRDRGPAALQSSKPSVAPAAIQGAATGSSPITAGNTATQSSGAGRSSIAPPAAPQGASTSTSTRMPSVRPPAFNAGTPIGVLVVGGAGLISEVRRATPKDAEISTVRSLAEGVLAARDASPDVIVAESVQPADGVGLVASLRGDPLTDFIPVIVVASPADRLDEQALRQQGVFDVLTTPINPEKLGRSIARAVETLLKPSVPPPSFGDLTLEELTKTLQDEIRRGLMGAAGPAAGNARVPLGQGTEVLAATWEAIARVREVVAKRTQGRVRFEMPSAPLGMGGAHVLAVGDDEDAVPEAEGEDPLPARTALVVDDEPNVVWFFANLLREAGMNVVECTDGAQALRDARKTRPDVVISDILMPGMDGFTLCRAIRRDVSLRYTPVVLLSWREDLITRMRELGAQAQGYLRKESKGEAILARVRSVLRPRVRLLRRIEGMGEGEEVRGRVERVGVFTLIEVAASSLRGATITVTDSFSVSEVELRGGRLVSVVRTAQDGSLSRGESALVQVLGSSAARFSIKRATHVVRSNVHGELSALLEGGAALIAALEDAVSGASLVEVASLDMDADAANAYAKTLPAPMRALIEKVASGDSPRELVLRDGIAPQELDPLLVELARRGVIRGAKGPNGEDLVAPRLEAQSVQWAESKSRSSVSMSMPAVLLPESLAQIHPKPESAKLADEDPSAAPDPALLVPPSPEAERKSDAEKTPSNRPSNPSWKRPTNMDEALAPGFGAQENDSLANALLAELRADEPLALATIKVRDEDISADGSGDDISIEVDANDPPTVNASEAPKSEAQASPEPNAVAPASEAPQSDAHDKPIELVAVKPAAVESERVPFSMEPPAPNSNDAAPVGVAVSDSERPRREVSGERPTASVRDEDVDDGPTFEEHEGEAALSEDELHAAANASPGLPLENIELDARGLPRRRARTQDVDKVSDDHKPQPVSTSDSSIIIDVAAVGGPVEVKEPPRKRQPSGERSTTLTGPTAWLWLLVAVVALGFLSYYLVRALLPTPAPSVQSSVGVLSGPQNSAVDPLPIADAQAAAAPVEDAASAEEPAVGNAAGEDEDAGAAPSAGLELGLDPAPFLDGGALDPSRGLLVVDGPGRVTIGSRELGDSPLRVELAAGQHNLTYRRGNVRGFRVIDVVARRAVRVVLPVEADVEPREP
jgi:CheY-like chemotaxis protein